MIFKILLSRSVQTPNSDKNWQTSCPLQTFVCNISRHLDFIIEQTESPGQLGLRVAGFPGHWVAGSQNMTQFHVWRTRKTLAELQSAYRGGDVNVDSLGDQHLKHVNVTSGGRNVDCRVSVLHWHSTDAWTIWSTTVGHYQCSLLHRRVLLQLERFCFQIHLCKNEINDST